MKFSNVRDNLFGVHQVAV